MARRDACLTYPMLLLRLPQPRGKSNKVESGKKNDLKLRNKEFRHCDGCHFEAETVSFHWSKLFQKILTTKNLRAIQHFLFKPTPTYFDKFFKALLSF